MIDLVIHSDLPPGCNWKLESRQVPRWSGDNHSSFGVRLVAPMARASARKRRQVAALHIGLVIVRISRTSRSGLTPTSNCTPSATLLQTGANTDFATEPQRHRDIEKS